MKLEYAEIYRRMGLKINYYRKLRRMTQEELAEKIDRSTGYLASVEAPNIERSLSLDTLLDIANALNVPAYKFLIDDDDV